MADAQGAQQTGSQAPPPRCSLTICSRRCVDRVICCALTIFNLSKTDALLSQFVARLKAAVEAGEVSSIITSRHLPGFAPPGEFEPLTGLSPQDMRRLLDRARTGSVG